MIKDDKDFRESHAALGDLYEAVAALRREYAATNPRAFQLLCEGPLQEIARISTEIDQYTGVALAEANDPAIWLRLEGERARWKETSSSVLAAFLDALRKGVQSISAFNSTKASRGRPPADLQRACDFELVAFQPGSFNVGLRLPQTRQMQMFPEEVLNEVQSALKEYLQLAIWVSSIQGSDELTKLFPDVAKRRVALRAFKPIIPRANGGISFVELSGREVPEARVVRIVHGTVSRVTTALHEAVSEEERQHVGNVREMDLDKRSFILRNVEGHREVKCTFSEDMQSVAASYLGKRVRVIGIQSSARGSLQVTDIDRETG